MNRWRDAVARYQGAVPTPFAVYRAPIVGGGSMLPFEMGIASFQLVELDSLRSIEALEDYGKEVRARITELDAEFVGVPFSEEARDEMGLLREQRDGERGIANRVTELRGRAEYIAAMAEADDVAEPGDSTAATRYSPPAIRTRKTDNEIHDVAEIRSRSRSDEEFRVALRDNAMRSVERAVFPHKDAKPDAARERIEKLFERFDEAGQEKLARLILTTGSPAYRRAFAKHNAGVQLSAEEQRALGAGVQGGGLPLPYTLDPTIIKTSNSSVNPMRAISRTEDIIGGNEWRGIASAGVVATRTAAGTAGGVATDGSPTLTQPTAVVTKVQVFIPFDIEEQQDYGRLETEMAGLIQDAKDDEEASVTAAGGFVTGTGAGLFPQGIVTGTTNTVAAATGLTVTAANVRALENALPPRFRPNEKFLANRGIYNVIAGIDTAGGAALWLYLSQGLDSQVPTPGNTGAILLGRGAWEASAMSATVVNATKILIVGDFSYFLIVDRIGMTVELIPHLFGAAQGNLPTGQRGLLALWRNTSKVLDPNAFRALTGTT